MTTGDKGREFESCTTHNVLIDADPSSSMQMSSLALHGGGGDGGLGGTGGGGGGLGLGGTGGGGGLGGSPLHEQAVFWAYLSSNVTVPLNWKVQLVLEVAGQVQWQVIECSGSPSERWHSEHSWGREESSQTLRSLVPANLQ